jgi:hypothetical protein
LRAESEVKLTLGIAVAAMIRIGNGRQGRAPGHPIPRFSRRAFRLINAVINPQTDEFNIYKTNYEKRSRGQGIRWSTK